MQFAPLFHDHAVLQRHISIPVWGVAGAKEVVYVSLAGQRVWVKSEADGRWLVRFAPLPAGGPYELRAESPSGTAVANDILIGDVWVCSGQSNMEWKLNQTQLEDSPFSLPDAPQIRVLTVTNPAALGQRQTAVDGRWSIGSLEELLNFSAVGTWFGRELHRELGVPIGLICNAWGGTRVQAWISRETFIQDPAGRVEVQKYEQDLFRVPTEPADHFIDFKDWERRGAPQDTGNAGLENGWASAGFDDRAWGTMPLPSTWQAHGHLFSGIFWFRHTVTVPAEWSGQDLDLHLGMIDKHDDTYVNGTRVGGLSWEAGPNSWCTPRKYVIPASLVGADRQVTIAVRVRSHVYNGGIFGAASAMHLAPVGAPIAARISLAGKWTYQIEQDWGITTPPVQWGADGPNSPYILFASRVEPLLPYAIRGVIWYQGESNGGEASLYRRLMPLMVRDWRRAWGQGDFPFLQVQLANYQAPAVEPGPSEWAELREAQVFAMTSEPNSGLAVIIDAGDAADIHPRDKKTVGLRLARWALADFYGRGGVPSGPLYRGAAVEAGAQIRVHFHHAGGLRTTDGQPLRHVAIAGADKKFVWAESRIENETLVVWSPSVSEPAFVRYAWATNPEGCNLENAAGLPASPFRTDCP